MLSLSNICSDYCPDQNKSPITEYCTNCLQENCTEIEKTTWIAERLGPEKYRFKPTRRILNPNYDYENAVDVGFLKGKYNYDVKKTINRE